MKVWRLGDLPSLGITANSRETFFIIKIYITQNNANKLSGNCKKTHINQIKLYYYIRIYIYR